MKLSPSLASLFVALVASAPVNAWFRVACTGPLVQGTVYGLNPLDVF